MGLLCSERVILTWSRPPIRDSGVCLAGESEGVSACSAACWVGVLERRAADCPGQDGDQGAGICCVPGGPRNGIPCFKKGDTFLHVEFVENSSNCKFKHKKSTTTQSARDDGEYCLNI